MTPKLKHTAQGFELHFGVNHRGCFVLTTLLLPKLMETAGSRIVITSSGQHRRAKIDWDDLNAVKRFSGLRRYGVSKLANLLFAVELDRRLRAAGVAVAAVACHPSLAGTGLGNGTMLHHIAMPLTGLF
jgi:NAD(P)-dependent dehydrogenase (short-subunit alcohol dehydrogenase family)